MGTGTEPQFCVASVGRSGSGYIAAVLSKAGLRCGHEQWWNPVGVRLELLGDSSWCAVPYLAGYRGAVFHQVRHPLQVLASLLDVPDWGPYIEQRRMLGSFEPGLEGAVETWVRWNLFAEQLAVERWRVEDLAPAHVMSVARSVGVELCEDAAVAAIAATPTTTNDHGVTTVLQWSDLPTGQCTDALLGMAERYGYT